MVLTPFSRVFQVDHGGQCTYPCCPGVILTSTPHNILSKILRTMKTIKNLVGNQSDVAFVKGDDERNKFFEKINKK